jgi:hypothetical protein
VLSGEPADELLSTCAPDRFTTTAAVA